LARFDSQKSINLPFSIKDTCFAFATEIPQQRGRGRPKIVKANNKENKSYTVSTISDGEMLNSSSSEDSKIVLVNPKINKFALFNQRHLLRIMI
jgi:hypothetical protein